MGVKQAHPDSVAFPPPAPPTLRVKVSALLLLLVILISPVAPPPTGYISGVYIGSYQIGIVHLHSVGSQWNDYIVGIPQVLPET